MVDWRALEQLTDRIVIGGNDELVRHSPIKSDGRADTARPQQEIRGVLHQPAPNSDVRLFGNVSVAAGMSALVVQRDSYPDVVFRGRDTIRSLERAGQPVWEVAKVNDRYSSIIVLELNQR